MFTMMTFDSTEATWALWIAAVGFLLVVLALSNSLVKRLPLSAAIIYLFVGYTLGSDGVGVLSIDPHTHAGTLERVTEIALLISLFSAGLKLNLPLRDSRWWLSIRLATLALLITIALLSLAAVAMGIPLAIAILIASALAPTDPVLASDVQIEHIADRDRLRFALTGESGLNDGIAFPFVALGLALMTVDAEFNFAYWFGITLLWSLAAGLAIGAALGIAIGKLVLYLRTTQKEAVGLDEFLVLGLIAISYGCAELALASPFVAVFAAGFALTRTSLPQSQRSLYLHDVDLNHSLDKLPELATHPQHAGPLMMRAVLGFNEQIERIAEAVVVILAGAMLSLLHVDWPLLLIPSLFFIARPLAVAVTLVGTHVSKVQRNLIGWFGIRGIGSMYYLFYAIDRGLPARDIDMVATVILGTVAASVIVHGISVTPLMQRYSKNRRT